MGTDEYLQFLKGKGFQLYDDAIGFIYFGKQYTNASDEQTNTAIELTLKAQKTFDGSFYMSLLEVLTLNCITSRSEAIQYVTDKKLLAL
ncbi:DUF6123 family protein [Bacillus dakarensis]|uniref:DUF6123 family protein n=1 Tax=Robertmurraya dakarensis TaxID=1926278 RepID=UPI000981E006|nr:DUF6123 family protein [Bacillus dakarensis]